MSLADLDSPAAVRKAMREYDRSGRDVFLRRYGFAPAREYMLVGDDGREYDSKAIAGVAHGYQFPDQGPLQSSMFSGGVGPAGAATKLSELGFPVRGISRDASDWSLQECEVTVEAYFDAVATQLRGKKVNKSALYREIASRLHGRTPDAVQYKFQNINAILREEGLPTLLDSVAPHYQQLLRYVVIDHVRHHPEAFEAIPAAPPPERPLDEVFVSAPQTASTVPGPGGGAPAPARRRPPLDFAARDARNKALGRAGEEWVLALEKRKLVLNGHPELAKRVRWTADEEGDGCGYDIDSFTTDGAPLHIEVKTPIWGSPHPSTSARTSMPRPSAKARDSGSTAYSISSCRRRSSRCRGQWLRRWSWNRWHIALG